MDLGTVTKIIESLQNQPRAIQIIAWVAALVAFLIFSYVLFARTPLRVASVSLERVSIFYVTIEPDMYQLGITARLFNNDTKAHKLDGIAIDPLTLQIGGEGNAYIQKIFVSDASAENHDDLVIKPGEYRDYNLLLPIKFAEKINGLRGPDIVFLSPFTLKFERGIRDLSVRADRYGNFERPITIDEWSKLLTPASNVNLMAISFKRTPRSQGVGELRDFIVFNPDRTATIDVYGFAKTDYKKTNRGTITMLKGNGEPILDGGWVLMANDYQELFRNPQMLALYESIVGRDGPDTLIRLDAGFRAADMHTLGPVERNQIPRMWDYLVTPPYIGPPR
jgi:hypothetical protein